nr:MAG TPA: hypothetical protein [Caudoviricetes sp.]
MYSCIFIIHIGTKRSVKFYVRHTMLISGW